MNKQQSTHIRIRYTEVGGFGMESVVCCAHWYNLNERIKTWVTYETEGVYGQSQDITACHPVVHSSHPLYYLWQNSDIICNYCHIKGHWKADWHALQLKLRTMPCLLHWWVLLVSFLVWSSAANCENTLRLGHKILSSFLFQGGWTQVTVSWCGFVCSICSTAQTLPWIKSEQRQSVHHCVLSVRWSWITTRLADVCGWMYLLNQLSIQILSFMVKQIKLYTTALRSQCDMHHS